MQSLTFLTSFLSRPERERVWEKMGPQWTRVTLPCLWAVELRKGLAGPECPDHAPGGCVEPQSKPAAWSPLLLDDEARPCGS